MRLVIILTGLLLLSAQAGSGSPSYYWILLSEGPNRPSMADVPEAELEKMQQEHLANLTRLYAEGKSRLAGPLGEPVDGTRGIVIVTLDDLETIQEEFRPDPFIVSGFLKIRAYRWTMRRGSFGSPVEPFELGKYLIGFVRAGGVCDDDARRAYDELERGIAGSLALAGPVEEGGDLCAIFLMPGSEKETVSTLLNQSPVVRSGKLKVGIHDQYLPKGMIEGD